MVSTRAGCGRWAVALLAGLIACGDTGPEGDASAATDTDDDGSSSTPVPTNPATSATSGSSETDASGTSTTGGADPSTSTAAETAGPSDTSTGTSPPGFDANGCPTDAPASWVSCENFDAIDDPETQISQWNVNGDAFGVEADPDDASDRNLRVTLTPGVMFGGWVTLRFGEGPDAPAVDSPDESYDEVWLRFRLRTGDDWPGRQIGDTAEIIAMNGSNWAIAADLNIQGDAAQRVHPVGWTCIFDGVQACDGSNDWAGTLQQIWNGTGPSTVFDAASAGEWKCMEAHMRLNTPGAADGEARVWVDGAEEHARTGIDWRGTWADYGLNAVRFTNFAAPTNDPLSFYIDDVVVATARVGCDR